MFCWHPYLPTEVFHTTIVTNIGRPDELVLRYEQNYHGYECRKCGSRKLIKVGDRPSPGETQEAFDWLNHKPKEPATVLELVKK